MLYYSYSRIIVGDKMGKLENMLNNTNGIGTTRLTAMMSNAVDVQTSAKALQETRGSYLTEQLKAYNTMIDSTMKLSKQLLQNISDHNLQASYHGFEEKLTTIMGEHDDISKLSKLKDFQGQLDNYFTNISKSVENDIAKEEQKTAVYKQINDVVHLISQYDDMTADRNVDNTSLSELVALYKQAIDQLGNYNKDSNPQLANRLLGTLKQLEAKVNDDINKLNQAPSIATVTVPNINKVVNQNERVFSLFANITDQIVDAKFVKEDGKIYARYTLEDGSTYYAIIPREDKVLSEERLFANLANVQMSRDSVVNMLENIIKNCQIYYNLNEYTRYIEKSYKGQVTPAIDNALRQYKARLNQMEKALTGQLKFVDSISPLLHGKTSDKFPGIVYHDVAPKDFYTFSNSTVPSPSDIEKHLIVDVLANDQIESTLTTKEMLETMYDHQELDKLRNQNYDPEVLESSQNNPADALDATTVINLPLQSDQAKASQYLDMRLGEMRQVTNSNNSNVTVTREDDPLYRNINTVMDLAIASAISDRKYQKGQGLYATMEYLKSGKTSAFTTDYGARELASKVDRDNYIRLLMENMVKTFAGAKKKSSEDGEFVNRMLPVLNFVQKELSNPTFNADNMEKTLLQDDNLLQLAITNFDYNYLDSSSEESVLLEQALEKGKNNNNQSALRISDAISKIRHWQSNSQFMKDDNKMSLAT